MLASGLRTTILFQRTPFLPFGTFYSYECGMFVILGYRSNIVDAMNNKCVFYEPVMQCWHIVIRETPQYVTRGKGSEEESMTAWAVPPSTQLTTLSEGVGGRKRRRWRGRSADVEWNPTWPTALHFWWGIFSLQKWSGSLLSPESTAQTSEAVGCHHWGVPVGTVPCSG